MGNKLQIKIPQDFPAVSVWALFSFSLLVQVPQPSLQYSE
jgi:hypothetical protein